VNDGGESTLQLLKRSRPMVLYGNGTDRAVAQSQCMCEDWVPSPAPRKERKEKKSKKNDCKTL
jgi:hypothetical protein